MEIFNKDLERIRKRKERAEQGLYNCIPMPFTRFRKRVPGTEQAKYIVITANQKIGKSKLCDFMYVYEPIFFIAEHPEINVKIEITYFTLEMSAQSKRDEFYCHLLNRLDHKEISPTDLNSTDKDNPIDDEILTLLASDKYQKYINIYNKIVTYIDDIKNPTGINKYCRERALAQGHLNYKKVMIKNPDTEKLEEISIVDSNNPFTPNDPELYRFIILDNYSNLTQESGLDKRGTIEKMSKYGIILRNQLLYDFIAVQHQAQAQEGIENQKLGKLKPSSDGLADCKTTVRDVNMVIGLYSPFKYGIKSFEGYNIEKFRNYIRFMEVIEDRDYGSAGTICPLFFNGAVSTFHELPLPKDEIALEKYYNYINYIESLKDNKVSKVFLSISENNNKTNNKSLQKKNIFTTFAIQLKQIINKFNK